MCSCSRKGELTSGKLYADTGLIINKLCALAKVANHRETEALGNAMFGFCAMLIPFEMISDEEFLKDRAELTGRPWTEESIRRQRPFALAQFLAHVATIEDIVRDGGGYVRDGRVTMADIHVAFVVQWVLLGHKGAEPEVSRQTHGSLYKWLEQVQAAVGYKKADKITFEQARKSILSATPRTAATTSVPHPMGLETGAKVTIVPVDTGRKHPQVGSLVYASEREICLRTHAGAHVSFPQAGYMLGPAKDSRL